MIKYDTDKPTEDGYYLLTVDGELCVAEALVYEDMNVEWMPTGADWDVWQHSPDTFQLIVHCKLDLETLVAEAKNNGH